MAATPRKWNTVYIRLPYAQFRSLVKFAKYDGVSNNQFIRAAVEKELRSREAREERKRRKSGETDT